MVNTFWSRKHLLSSFMAWTQSTLKSVEILLLTSKTFRSSPVPSVVCSFIVKYHRTGNICFKLFFLLFATHWKTSLEARHCAKNTAQWVVPRRQLREPLNSSEAQVQVLSHSLFLRQRLLLPGSTAASLQLATVFSELGIRVVASSLLVTPCLCSVDHEISSSPNSTLNLKVGL